MKGMRHPHGRAVGVACLVIAAGVVPASAATVIVDNVDAGFTILSGTWSSGAYATPYGADYRYATTVTGAPTAEVEWRPNLPTSGAYEVAVWYVQGTNRASNAPFTIDHAGGSSTVLVNQQTNGSQWVVLGTYTFNAGTGGRVRLNNSANPSVVIADAVRFAETSPPGVNLTMAVSPAGAGTTVPAVGGPYAKTTGEVVNISATANAGYAFSYWTCSAGSAPASPNSASTTVTMDANKTVTAVFTPTGATPEFRAFWADAFAAGFKSTSQIDTMVNLAVQGNYNAIIAEVMAYQDNVGSGHGAYWNSSILPKATDIVGGIDPLAYLVSKAHAANIEVHCWLVTYRVCTTWPPAGNAYLAAHPEFLMVPSGSIGTVAKIGTKYVLDPGSPDVQEYLISIVRELVTNYAIDGIHWDYIRYEQTDAGYPSDTSYAKSGLARFKQITGYSGTPPYSGYTPWNDFRRREVTELVRRTRAEIAAITTNPRQPVRHTAALITWGTAPSSFSSTNAYALFSNWEEWLRLGYLDMGIPMNYFSEVSYPGYYAGWVNKEVVWRGPRHIASGPGIYLNTFANSKYQIEYARNAGLNGISTYSYADTRSDSGSNTDWYPYAAANVFPGVVSTPIMPWRYPATATEGTLWGRVTDANTGQPIDDATVQVGAMTPVKTDGNGYYVVTLVPATAAGTLYTVTASKTGYPTLTHTNVAVFAGDLRRDDLPLGAISAPTITQHPTPQSACASGSAQFVVGASGAGTLTYQWQKNGANLANGGHYAGVTTDTLTVSSIDAGDLANYRCVVTNAGGSATSNAAALTLKTPAAVTQHPVPQSVCSGTTVQFSVTATGDGTLSYLWQKNGVALNNRGHYSGVLTATLTITGADATDAADYRCVVTGDCNSVTSNAATLTILAAPGFSQHPAAQSVCPGGTAQFSVAATGGGTLTYQWQKNGSSLADGGHYSGATTAVLTVSSASSDDVADYRCVVTGACGNATSSAAGLSLKTATQITAHPAPQIARAGDPVAFSVTAAGSGLSYQWQKDGNNLTNDGHYSGVNTPTLSLASAAPGDQGSYRCVVQGECGPQTSNAAALTITVRADLDRDGDVDGNDFGVFAGCFNGAGNPVAAGCSDADFNADGAVDGTDYGTLANCFNGSGNVPSCAP